MNEQKVFENVANRLSLALASISLLQTELTAIQEVIGKYNKAPKKTGKVSEADTARVIARRRENILKKTRQTGKG